MSITESSLSPKNELAAAMVIIGQMEARVKELEARVKELEELVEIAVKDMLDMED